MPTFEQPAEEKMSAKEREEREKAERLREKEEQASTPLMSLNSRSSLMCLRAPVFLVPGTGRSRYCRTCPTGNAREGSRGRDSEEEAERGFEGTRANHGWQFVQGNQGRRQHLDCP